jgi:hypothetical protein
VLSKHQFSAIGYFAAAPSILSDRRHTRLNGSSPQVLAQSATGRRAVSIDKRYTTLFKLLMILGILLCSYIGFADAKTDRAPIIIPLHTKVRWDKDAGSAWKANVYSSSSRKVYVLWLYPEYEAHQNLAGVDLVLNEAGDHDWDKNLLAPRGDWHGHWPFMISAFDLADGPQGMSSGPDIRIPVKDKGIVVETHILDAKVSALPDGSYKLEQLELSISVENLDPGSSAGR